MPASSRRRRRGESPLAKALKKSVALGATVYGVWDSKKNITLVDGKVSVWGKVAGTTSNFTQGTAGYRPGHDGTWIVPDQVDDMMKTGIDAFITNDIMLIVVYEHAMHGSSGRRLIGMGPAGQNALLLTVIGGNGMLRASSVGLGNADVAGGAAGQTRGVFVNRDASGGGSAVKLAIRRGRTAEVVGTAGTPSYGDVQITLFGSNDATTVDGSYHKVKLVAALRSVNGNNRAAIQDAWMPVLAAYGANLD
jgi:hypothetical protein